MNAVLDTLWAKEKALAEIVTFLREHPSVLSRPGAYARQRMKLSRVRKAILQELGRNPATALTPEQSAQVAGFSTKAPRRSSHPKQPAPGRTSRMPLLLQRRARIAALAAESKDSEFIDRAKWIIARIEQDQMVEDPGQSGQEGRLRVRLAHAQERLQEAGEALSEAMGLAAIARAENKLRVVRQQIAQLVYKIGHPGGNFLDSPEYLAFKSGEWEAALAKRERDVAAEIARIGPGQPEKAAEIRRSFCEYRKMALRMIAGKRRSWAAAKPAGGAEAEAAHSSEPVSEQDRPGIIADALLKPTLRRAEAEAALAALGKAGVQKLFAGLGGYRSGYISEKRLLAAVPYMCGSLLKRRLCTIGMRSVRMLVDSLGESELRWLIGAADAAGRKQIVESCRISLDIAPKI